MATPNYIQKTPTIKTYAYKVGNFTHDGPLKTKDILDFFIRSVFPNGRELVNNTVFQNMTQCQSCLLLFTDSDSKEQLLNLKTALSKHPYVQLFKAVRQNHPTVSEFKGKFNVAFYNSRFKNPIVLSSDEIIEVGKLDKFLEDNVTETIVILSADVIEELLSKEESCILLFTNNLNSSNTKEFKKFAFQKKGIKFGIGNLAGDWVRRFASFLGINNHNQESLMALRYELGQVVKHKPLNFDPVYLSRFLNEFKSGHLPVFYKSESLPEKQNPSFLKIVGLNFKGLVVESNTPVLLVVTSHNCSHSDKFVDVVSQLITSTDSQNELVFAQMDGTLNDVPGLDFKYFPSVYLYFGNGKSTPVEFLEERNAIELTRFLSKELKIPPQKKKPKNEKNENEDL